MAAREITRRDMLAGVGAISLLGLLTACTRAASSATTSATATLADSGKQIDLVRIALPDSLSNLYPGQEAGILNYYIAAIAQEGLVRLDEHRTLQPALAKSWTQPDDRTYVYTIREDATFQDGTALKVSDIVFSIEQAQSATLSPSIASYLSGIESVKATGTHELTVVLKTANPAFGVNLSPAGALWVTSEAFWKKASGKVGTAANLVLGTGPYKVTEFEPDSHVTFDRVDTWWDGTPKAKSLKVQFIPDENTRFLAAKRGELDVVFNVPVAQTAQWEALSTVRMTYLEDLSYVGLYFDTAKSPFNDVNVRRAIAHSVDRAAIVKKVLLGHGEVATSLMTPASLGGVYSASAARKLLAEPQQWTFDLAAAKKALAASAHPKGFSATITYPSTGPQLGTAAQALAENLKSIGITLTVQELPISQWLATLGDGKHGIGFMWYFSTTGDPSEVPSYLLGEGNISGFTDAGVTAALAKAATEADLKTRVGDLLTAEKLQAAQAVNVPLWWGQSAIAFRKDLGFHDESIFAFTSPWPAALYQGK